MEIVADYQALHEGAVLAKTAAKGQIAVAGQDRAAYLQGLLTNDVLALRPGSGCYATWLTPQGRLLTDMHVLESGEMMLLDLPLEQVEATLQRLDQFLFSEDVQLADLRPSLTSTSIHGPRAAAILQRVLSGIPDVDEFADYQNRRTTFDGSPVVLARIDELGVPGFTIYIEPSAVATLEARLLGEGALRASEATVQTARVEAGVPLFGVDMSADTIPLEAGIEGRAISFSKGCYVGQEVIIRVLHRGHGRVAKKLVTLRVEGTAPPAQAKVFSADREIGVVTSSATSPRFGTIALAYLHRDFLTPGTRVDVDHDGRRQPATVSERPLPPAA